MTVIQPTSILSVVCPLCGKGMKLRSGSFGPFYGCSTYPTCKGTRKGNYVPQENIPSVKSPVVYTTEQVDIHNWIVNGKGNLLIEAGAGCGKTSTIGQCIQKVKDNYPGQSVLYLVFNKENQKEAQDKGLPASTTHSYGYQVIKANGYKVKVDPNKVFNLVKSKLKNSNINAGQQTLIASTIRRIITLVKNNAIFSLTSEIITHIAEIACIELPESDVIHPALFFNLTIEVFEESCVLCRSEIPGQDIFEFRHLDDNLGYTIDYDDMLFLPLYHKMSFNSNTYDWVFADEVQDFNTPQLRLTQKACRGRTVAVGDRNQACYLFRGAALDAMDLIKDALQADELTLSVTFRCPENVVRLVNSKFPHIKFAKNPLNQTIGNVLYKQVKDYDDLINQVGESDMVISRINAPLIGYVLEMIRNGKKAYVIGKDIAQGLKSLVQRFLNLNSNINIEDFLYQLNIYVNLESSKLRNKGKDTAAELLIDKRDTLEAIGDNCKLAREILDKIDMIFDDRRGGTAFSTIHKAKGLEANRVHIIKHSLIPIKKGLPPEQDQQEENLRYIAYTRAIRELYIYP